MNTKNGIFLTLRNIVKQMKIMLDNELSGFRLNHSCMMPLVILYNNDGINQEKLASLLGVNKSNTSRALNQLEKHGYIKKIKSIDDKRAYEIFLTNEAKEIENNIIQIKENIENALTYCLSPKENSQLLQLLSKLNTFFTQEHYLKVKNKTCHIMNNQTQSNKNHSGPTSFNMQDHSIIFEQLNLLKGMTFLDFGCGLGDYTLHASKILKDNGIIIAADKSRALLNRLKDIIKEKKIQNIDTIQCDINSKFPIYSNSVNVCLISTVLHCIDMETFGKYIFEEVKRVLTGDGILVIIDCNVDDLTKGPPIEMRIPPETMEEYAKQAGFIKTAFINMGFNYLIKFSVKE